MLSIERQLHRAICVDCDRSTRVRITATPWIEKPAGRVGRPPKLTPDQVEIIRSTHGHYDQLMERFAVSVGVVWRAKTGRPPYDRQTR
jgi:hypothetical protein